MMNDRRKSDRLVVPRKPPNNAGRPAAEVVEGSERAKGNSPESHDDRTQRRVDASAGIERVRQAARKDRRQRFTALLHHVYEVERLRAAYLALKRDAAAGIDGETWRRYGEALDTNLRDLSARIARGAFRASPVRRAYIPKADGRQRPLGVPTLEDKIVQRAVVEVLTAIYEQDFLGFSYGFRPKRSPHQALDALTVGIETKKVNWVLDADIQGFFDTLNHEWLVRFLEHRVADRRVVHLVQRWLRAGVLEDGQRRRSDVGTVQGGSISPLLANIYLHYVFDLWVQRWRQTQARGDVIVVRFADDFVVGFEHRAEAERFLAELRERFARFGLTLHPDKTRLIEFGRAADRNRRDRGDGKPDTFNFLGFTHACSQTRKGRFTVLRQTMRRRWQAKLRDINLELRRRLHESIPEQGIYLRSVLVGHTRYYGVPRNGPSLMMFRRALTRLWRAVLMRRSQTAFVSWTRMARLAARWLPVPHICHPYPDQRLAFVTQGKSRMR
ncbi:MAG: group II intron reverse transcriptase/maturase [Betaproteobacteria bacterium]